MRVYWDVETEPTAHDVETPPAVVAAVAVDDGPVRLFDPEDAAIMLRAYAARGATMVGHATSFDIAVLGLEPSDFPTGWYDTQIRGVIQGAAAGQHEAASSGLKQLAAPLGVVLGGKGTTQLSFRVGQPLTPEQEEYARQDVVATRAVFLDQGAEARMPDEARQTRISWDVWKMARRGVRLDVPRVQMLLMEARGRVSDARGPVAETGLIQPRGPKKDPWREEAVSRPILQQMLRDNGVTAKPKRRRQDTRPESGLLCGDDEVLRATGDLRLLALADYRAAQKWLSLVEAFDVGSVARAFWKSMVASGRISASRPNLTQVPKGPLRSCVIPSEGNVLVTADYSMLEFRAWADIAYRWLGWSAARDALVEGLDVHSVLAEIIGGDRQAAKAGNYGFLGGMGVPRLAAQYGLTEERAEEVRRAWRKTWPEWRQYFDRIARTETADGRCHTTLPWSGRERVAYYSEAANFLIQGTGADIAKEALALAHRAGLPVTMLIHDELVLDVPRAQASEAAVTLEECMDEAGRTVCPNVPWKQSSKIVDSWG